MKKSNNKRKEKQKIAVHKEEIVKKDKIVRKKSDKTISKVTGKQKKIKKTTTEKKPKITKKKKSVEVPVVEVKRVTKPKRNIIKLPSTGVSSKEISEKIQQPVSKITAEFLSLGIFVSPDQVVTDRDAIQLVLDHFGYDVEFIETEEKPVETLEQKPSTGLADTTVVTVETTPTTAVEVELPKKEIPPGWIKKVPVVTVMGHVDHGKTTLLDSIRKTNIVAKEYGAITQHIGAYKVKTSKGDITFIDTPGHEAFSAIRARGAKVTDIVVLVIAGDEGIKPQTLEAIDHAKAANVPIIVAVNKIDLPQCDVNSVKQQCSKLGLVPKDWGGEIDFVPISARNNINIDKLLETILLRAELLELYVPIDVPCEATVVETKLDSKRGFVGTVIVNKGKLKNGDSFVCGYSYGKVRAMFNENGERLTELIPGEPAEIVGFEVPASAGDTLKVVANEKEARKIYEEIEHERKLQAAKIKAHRAIEDIISGKSNLLSIVVKTDTQGSSDAIQKMLEAIAEEVKSNPSLPELKIIHISVGEISESDVLLAAASNAVILGFNVKSSLQASQRAKIDGVEIRIYRIIYELIDDVRKILQRMEVKKEVEEVLGRARVKKIFEISKVGKIAGCYVEEGSILRNARARLIRGGNIIIDSRIISLKHFKDDVKEIQQGFECGIRLEGMEDIKEGDLIECYQVVVK
ncbi:MAG: translation initiation factor IF-2 [Endomicrobia bacterium]|nr:translation initiation factor IF-2 [Endomicrobiia bacterium]